METGKIYINGLIGNIPSQLNGITILDMISQVENLKHLNEDLKTIEVVINSEGGVVEDGDQIFDYLESLKKDFMVNTKSAGPVSSIASKIFLVGTIRKMRKQDRMLIHNPWTEGAGNASALEQAADELRDIEARMVKFYAKQTGLNETAVKAIMDNETVLDAERAKELGFVTEVIEAPLAFAYHVRDIESKENENNHNPIINLFNMKNLNLKTAIAFLQSLTKENTVVNLEMMTLDGMKLISTAETAEGLVGSTVSVVTEEGEAPLAAGTYELDNSMSIVVDENSVVTEVIEASTEDIPSEETVALQAQIDELKAALEAEKSEKSELMKKLEVITSDEFKENVAMMQKGIEEMEKDKVELKKLKTAFNLPLNHRFEKHVEVEKDIAAEAKERRDSYKKRGISVQ